MQEEKISKVLSAISRILKSAGTAANEIEPAFNELKDHLRPVPPKPKKKVRSHKKKKG
jgi:hypothetical protein